MATIDLGIVTNDINSQKQQVTAFPDRAVAITPHATDVFSAPVSVFVGVAGTVTIVPAGQPSTTVQFTMPAGSIVPCRAIAVRASGTAATGLVAVY